MSLAPKKVMENVDKPLDDLPDLPDFKSLDSKEKAEMAEWWRLVRETLKRNHDKLTGT